MVFASLLHELWLARVIEIEATERQQRSLKRRLDNARLAQLQIAYEKYVRGEVESYISEVLPPEEYKQIFNECHQINCRIWKSMPTQQIDDLTRGSVHHDLKQSGCVPVLSFEAFCQKRVSPRF